MTLLKSENQISVKKPKSIFRILYIGNLVLLSAVFIYVLIKSLISSKTGDEFELLFFIAIIWCLTPILTLFMTINFIGFITKKENRYLYLGLSIVLLIISIWGWYTMVTMPFP
jgi:hypothetical protein